MPMPVEQNNTPFETPTPVQPQPAMVVRTEQTTKRIVRFAWYVFICTLVLAPLSFWPSAYVPLELVKTIVVSIGVLLSAILCTIVIIKEGKITLPPKIFVWLGLLIALSLIVSSIASGHFNASFFGQGFEMDTASFLLILLLSGLVAWTLVMRRKERAFDLYVIMTSTFLLLFIFQGLRLLFGQKFLTLGILTSLTSTVFGNWYSFGISAYLIPIIAISALTFLRLPRSMKIIYWVVAVASYLTALIINAVFAWWIAALIFLGMALYVFFLKKRPENDPPVSFVRRIPWILSILFILSALLAWRGSILIGPVVNRIGVGYSELSLPWQMTLDVATGALKNQPIVGVGPNRFSKAYLAYKPVGVNLTDAWSVDFNSGVSLFSTFVTTEGLLGMILWILLFIFIGIFGARMFRRMPAEPQARFMLISSYAITVFLWLISIVYVPTHVILFYTCVMTGIWLAVSSAYGCFESWIVESSSNKRLKYISVIGFIAVIIFLVWGVWCVKGTIALAYYGNGAKELTVKSDPTAALASFKEAASFNNSDIYWQARVTAGLALANQLLNQQAAVGATASTSQAVIAQVGQTINQAAADAALAVKLDPSDYANYISEAQVFALAANLGVSNAYQNAVQAYTRAIQLDEQDPSLYLVLAQLEASNKDYANAVKAIGASLQVKNNYPDAAFLLAQVEAAQGNLSDAITAAQFDTQLDPSNPLTFFQLGLLYYDNNQFDLAAQAFTSAVALQPNYANAEYYLGLSDARLGNTSGAITEFEQLAASNPDNQSVTEILAALKSGKSIFTTAPSSAAVSSARTKLPIQQSH